MSKDCTKRLKEHNSGKTQSTKAYIPWEIIHTEEYLTRKEARERDVNISANTEAIKVIEEKIAAIDNGDEWES